MGSQLDWPRGFERTDPDDRENVQKFSNTFRESESDIRDQMRRMDVEDWRLEDVTGSGGDPGVALYWTKGGEDHAIACDSYTHKKQNIRELVYWLDEVRKSGDRPVVTGQDTFAAAALPPGEGEDAAGAEPMPSASPGDQLDVPPHDILGVAPDADEEAVRSAVRELIFEVHPDHGGSEEAFERVRLAKRAMTSSR